MLGRRRCAASSAGDDASDLLFPDTISSRPSSRRPKSIEEIEEEEEDTDEFSAKRRRLNEVWRYDVDHGGALGVGMGVAGNGDWVLIDDLDPKSVLGCS